LGKEGQSTSNRTGVFHIQVRIVYDWADPITTQLDLDSWRKSEKSLKNTLKLIEPQQYIYIYILHAVYIYNNIYVYINHDKPTNW
jgi:hypothetical protein